jgi:arylsulfatase A-like enzyme
MTKKQLRTQLMRSGKPKPLWRNTRTGGIKYPAMTLQKSRSPSLPSAMSPPRCDIRSRLCIIGLVGLGALASGACKPDVEEEPGLEKADPDVALVFSGPRPKNVLMISVDTLRRDHVGRYMDGESLTPFLDGLLAEGVALDDFTQCANWTFPGMVCTLSGRTPSDNQFVPRFDREFRKPVPLDRPTLATRLSSAGWSTFYESTNTWFGPSWQTATGYEERILTGILHAEGVLGEAAEYVAEADPNRWFLHVHVKEPHAPYAPLNDFLEGLEDLEPLAWDLGEFAQHYESTEAYPALTSDEQALLESHMRLRYRGEVQWLDRQLSDAFDTLEGLGLLDDTLVVMWTDHGEAFWERGHQTHAYTLHGEENDAVALMWAKNLKPRAWTEPTASVDIVPTVLQALGRPVPEDVSGHVVGKAPPDRTRHALTLGRIGAISSIERAGLKLMFSWDGHATAYDRTVDPDEADDRFDLEDPHVLDLWEALRTEVDAASALTPELTVTWPE